MKFSKQFAIIFTILLLNFLISCQDSKVMSTESYAKDYYASFTPIESLLSDALYPEYSDLLNPFEFDTVYDHEDGILYLDKWINDIDTALYALSQMGPKIHDEDLQKYQSKLEYALLDYMNVLKEYQTKESFTVMVPNQFALYQDVFNMMNELTDSYIKILKNQLMIETELANAGYGADLQYYQNKQNNIYRFAYMYFVLGTQVSTYQTYSGLQVDPKFSNTILTASGDQYDVIEFESSVMQTLSKNVESLLSEITNFEETFGQLHSKTVIKDELNHYLSLYDAYFAIRSIHPYDFFKKQMFIQYSKFQKKEGIGRYSWWGYRDIATIYSYDEKYESTHHLLEMKTYYDALYSLIYTNDHKTLMSIGE